MSTKCYKCSKNLDLVAGKDIGRSIECSGCLASLRCCKMCKFYDTSSYNDCREPTAERIVEKEKANFCDHFKLCEGLNNTNNGKNAAMDAANALFKK